MKLMSYENLELFVKTINSELPGLNLIIHPFTTERKLAQRIVFTPTAYLENALYRKLATIKRVFFVEFPIKDEDFLKNPIPDIFNLLEVSITLPSVINSIDVKFKPSRVISEEEWKTFGKDYKKALEDYKTSCADQFPWVKITPRPTGSSSRYSV